MENPLKLCCVQVVQKGKSSSSVATSLDTSTSTATSATTNQPPQLPHLPIGLANVHFSPDIPILTLLNMRILCDACESAAATFFCAADEAALCCACDDNVHMCNKLASRHVRVKLADPSAVPRCDICENASAFFYCEVDGSSLCMQCDMIVHVGGKKTHARYLLLRQRVEFPTNKLGQFEDPGSQVADGAENKRELNQPSKETGPENQQNHRHSPAPALGSSANGPKHVDTKMIDLNMKPQRLRGPTSNNQK